MWRRSFSMDRWRYHTLTCFPAVKQGLIWIKTLKKSTLNELYVQKPWWQIFYKWVKSWKSTTLFRISQFLTPTWKQNHQCHIMTKQFIFGRIESILNYYWHKFCLWTRQVIFFVFSPILYDAQHVLMPGLWVHIARIFCNIDDIADDTTSSLSISPMF
jgi:hypothetical protein